MAHGTGSARPTRWPPIATGARWTLAIGLVPLFLAFAPGVTAQTTAILTGRVASLESEKPLDEVRILVVGTRLTASTDGQGRFRFQEMPVGRQALQIEYMDTVSDRMDVLVRADRRNNLDILLGVEVVPLPTLTVTVDNSLIPGKLTGFYRRMDREPGVFITRQDILERRPNVTSDLLRRVPGVRVGALRPGGAPYSMARNNRDCQVEFFLDGARAPFLDIDALPPEDLDGIEIYRGPSEVPPAFRRRQTCAAIILWTRDPGS